MLTQYILPNGAVAGLLTYLAGWRLSFIEYVSALPMVLRWGFYACLFILAFTAINHGRQWLIDKEVQQGGRANGEPQTPVIKALDDEDLRQRCRKLSVELFEFYRQEQEDLKRRLRYTVLTRKLSDGSQIRREATDRHDKQTMDKYGEQFGSDVLALSNDLARGDWISLEDQKKLRNPTKPQDIQYIAQCLRAICGKSSED